MHEKSLIDAIRMIANDRGWNEIDRDWSDGDILGTLSENQFDIRKTIVDIYMNITDTSYKHQREYNPDNYRGI
jgi:hypothetical protein